MAFHDAARFKESGEILLQELDNEAVLLDLDGERYYGLDPIGLRIFRLLTAGKSIAETCSVLLQEYDVAPEQLRSDVEDLLTRLLDVGLLVESND